MTKIFAFENDHGPLPHYGYGLTEEEAWENAYRAQRRPLGGMVDPNKSQGAEQSLTIFKAIKERSGVRIVEATLNIKEKT